MLTHDEWMTLLAPALSALVLAAATIIGAVATGISGRIKTYLDAKGQAEASKVLTDASTRVQSAMQNEAGNIALEIGAGHLDVTDLAAVNARAVQGEAAIVAKLPHAVDLLKPIEGAIAQGIAGKLGLPMIPAVAPAAVAGVEGRGART